MLPKIITIALLLVTPACLFGCANHSSSSNDASAAGNQPSLSSALSPAAVQQAAQAAKTANLPQPNWDTPDSAYVPVTKGSQLMFLYAAFSGLPPDYDTMAQAISNDYRITSDAFRKRDLLNALKPKLDAGIADAKAHPYIVWVDSSSNVGHYDFNQHSFPVASALLQQGGSGYMMDNPSYTLAFTNGAEFQQLHVEDQATAKAIEQLVSHNESFVRELDDALNMKIFAYVQSTDDSSRPTVQAVITKVELLGHHGEVLLTQAAKH